MKAGRKLEHGTVADMRSAVSLALALALAMHPGVARAAGWSQAQRDTHDKIIGRENVGDLAGAVQLAVQEFADVTAPPGTAAPWRGGVRPPRWPCSPRSRMMTAAAWPTSAPPSS